MEYYPANRVVQLDVKLLDNDLIKLFQLQFDDLFKDLFYNNKFLTYYNQFKNSFPILYYFTQLFSGIKLKLLFKLLF